METRPGPGQRGASGMAPRDVHTPTLEAMNRSPYLAEGALLYLEKGGYPGAPG